MTIGEYIRQKRKEAGLSAEELGKKIGKNRATIYRYENNSIEKLPTNVLIPLANALAITPGDLIKRNENTTFVLPSVPISPVKGIRIPILGRVVAGIPLEAIEDIEGWEEITPRMASGGEFFALRIRGSSMEPKLVEGDVVIVRKQSTVDNGDIAIVLVNGNEATCKQVNRTPAGITLIGFNIAVYAPHFYTNDQIESLPVTIVGKVVESRHTW